MIFFSQFHIYLHQTMTQDMMFKYNYSLHANTEKHVISFNQNDTGSSVYFLDG
jgi:hypothetical protein